MKLRNISRRLGLALLAVAALAAVPALAAPVLRPAVTVDANVIRLGDLFANAGPHAADIVAPAPPPGSRTLFDAAWLAATAHEHQLDWQPASSFDQASVERDTRTVTADVVTQSVLQAIARHQSVEGAQLHLDNPGFRLLVPANAPAGLDVEGLTIDPRSGRFSAMVAAFDENATPERVTGRLIRMIKLPVLDRPVAPGETIAASDITTLTLRADHVWPDIIADARQLIGKTPCRPLPADQPLHNSDVRVPIVVHKDDLVTIVLETPTMRLTAQGKALEDGAMGTAIRVANTKSSRVIDATVTGPNLVAVITPALLATR